MKVWVGYGFSFLAPLLKEGGTLADLEPKNQLERDIVSCLAAVLQ